VHLAPWEGKKGNLGFRSGGGEKKRRVMKITVNLDAERFIAD